MASPSVFLATAALLGSLLTLRLAAAAGSVSLASNTGARLEFSGDESGWRWSRLITPEKPEGWPLVESGGRFAAGDGDDSLAASWELMANEPDKLVFEQTASASGVRIRRVFSFGPAANVVRIAVAVKSLDQAKLLNHVGLLTLGVEGESFRTKGRGPASFPVFGEALFAGVEAVCGESDADTDRFALWQTPDLSLGDDWQPVATVVVGWHLPRAAGFLPGESRTREAFLQYLDTIRVKPEDINLHSDTWWTLPMPFTEADVLRDVAALRKGFFERTGLFFDTYALDLGWSNPRSFWRIDAKNFPTGLGNIRTALADLKCRMGMWVSPSSGYSPGLDNAWLEAQGYEMTTVGKEGDKVACFALGGRYQREFAETIVGYAREYGLGHVIFDGMQHSCDNPAHLHATGVGSTYTIHAGFKDVMDQLRRVNPKIVLEPLSCGHPPSPWWNLHTPFLLGPAGDDVPYGRVPCPDWTEALTSARDIAYRAGQENWLVRTQALETFDIIVQSPGGFQNMAVMAAGRGRWFMSANIRPELMQPADWDFLAGLVRWQRHHKQSLVDARMIGGKPERREAYGYMFHQADRDLYCIRNPWIEARSIRLPARVREAVDVQMIYPRRSRVARIQPEDDGATLVLGPYETMFLETVPAEGPEAAAPADLPRATLSAGAPEIVRADRAGSKRGFGYVWNGTVVVPEVENAELCLLVEGSPEVAGSQVVARVNGHRVRLERKGSAGQFGAAVDPSPDNWIWFIVPLAPGRQSLEISLDLPVEKASVGIYLRATVPASSDEAPKDVPAFPVFRPDRREWSQTLQPLKLFEERSGDDTAN